MKADDSKRRAIRFRPNTQTLAMIDPRQDVFEPFQPSMFALVHNESSTGVGVVALSSRELMTGQNVRVQVGDMAPVIAEIRWRTDLDQDVIRLGLMFLST